MTGMDFGSAIKGLKAGHKLSREGWNGKGMHIYMVRADEDRSPPKRAYIVMKTAQDDEVPWVASQTDILAEDWELV